MVVVKRQGREKPAKIEQRTSEDRSEDLRYNKQHSWLAWLAQFTYGRPRGRRKHIKRGAKGPGVCLSVCLSLFSLSLFLSLALALYFVRKRAITLHNSSLRVFASAFPLTSRMYFPAIF